MSSRTRAATGSASTTFSIASRRLLDQRLRKPLQVEIPFSQAATQSASRYLGVEPARADAVVASYEDALETADTHEIWATLFSDVEMQRPAAAVRDAHRAHGRVYSYLFGWPARNRALGACHGIDIPFTFGNFVDGWDDFVGRRRRGTGAVALRCGSAWAEVAVARQPRLAAGAGHDALRPPPRGRRRPGPGPARGATGRVATARGSP